jgi:hypothetical protein
MATRVQAATSDPGSVLLRTSAAARHGLGTALSELIEQDVDISTLHVAVFAVEHDVSGRKW